MSRIDEINAILDDLGEAATYEQIEYALRDYGQREVLEVLADRQASAGGAGESVLLNAELTLTNAQIKTLPSTYFTLIAAAGANTVVLPVSGYLLVVDPDYSGYTNRDPNMTMKIAWQEGASTSDDVIGFGTPVLADLLIGNWPASIAQAIMQPNPDAGDVSGNSRSYGFYDAPGVNAPLRVTIANGALGNLTGGADNITMKIGVLYRVVDL